MGAMQNNPDKRGNPKKKRGSVKNADRLGAFRKDSPGEGADWGGCDPQWLQNVVCGITELGGAVTFGLSRDKGAHSLTLLLDDGRQTLWYNGGAELDDELRDVVATLVAMKAG